MKYSQLTLEQRYTIEKLIDTGTSKTEIAEIIGVHKSTVYRELNRNTPKRGQGAKKYVALNAEQKTRKRHKEKPKKISFTTELKAQAREWITEKRFSPELVSAQWKKTGIRGVSHETIYKFIWYCKQTNKAENEKYKNLYKYLRHGKRRRKRGNYRSSRSTIPNRVSIEERPEIVNKRCRQGDIEVDLIVGKNHKSALLITVDRATLQVTINKLKNRKPENVANKLISRIKAMPEVHTATFDNDHAFRLHKIVAEKTNIKTFFTRPYTSQDKGTVENRNGLIRAFYPKKTDFNLISDEEIKKTENLINNRPVRKFNYLTPNEVALLYKGKVALMT